MEGRGKVERIRCLKPKDLNAVRHKGVFHVFPSVSECKSYCGRMKRSDCNVLQERSKPDVRRLSVSDVENGLSNEEGIGSYCKRCTSVLDRMFVEQSEKDREMSITLIKGR